MKTGYSRHFVALSVLALLLPTSGCFSNYKNRVNQQLWEREMRLQEDCIYRLRWQLEDKQRELDEANARANSLNKQTDILRGGGSSTGPDLGPPPAFNPSAPRSTPAPPLPPAPAGMPEVQPGKAFTPGAYNAPQDNSGDTSGLSPEPEMADPAIKQAGYSASDPSAKPPNHATADDHAARPVERLNPDTEIESIELNDGLTGEINSSGEAGAGYLNVVIEQRDSHGKRVLAPGDVSIVVVDPALDGPAARIARWSFDSDDIPQHVRRNHDGGSLQFELPWSSPPEHNDLRVFVRFTTFDGRRLEANLPIDVQAGAADPRPRGWKKPAPTSARSEKDIDQFAGAADAAGRGKANSVYQPDASDAGPALASQPTASEPPTNAPPANSSATSSSNDKPLLDASRRPAWSPYR